MSKTKLIIQFFVTLLIVFTSTVAIYYVGDLLSQPIPFWQAAPLTILLLGVFIVGIASVISFFMELYKYIKQ